MIFPDVVVIVTAASPAVISSAALDTVSKDNAPLPFVFKNCPLEPSEDGTVNAVPPDVNIKLLPSEDTDSFASCYCYDGEPPEYSKRKHVSAT